MLHLSCASNKLVRHESENAVIEPESSIIKFDKQNDLGKHNVMESTNILRTLKKASIANASGIIQNGLKIPEEAFNRDQMFCQISPAACSILYSGASLHSNRRILEVGALFGCSTACIASGISDSKNGATFESADLFLETVKEFEDYFAGLCENSKGKAINCEPHGTVKWALENGGFKKYYDMHLQKLKLSDYVIPRKGDFKQVIPPGEYDMIYLDVTHSASEIQRNVPYVIKNFARDGTLIVFDDIQSKKLNLTSELQAVLDCHTGSFIERMYSCIVKKA